MYFASTREASEIRDTSTKYSWCNYVFKGDIIINAAELAFSAISA
jgi:hypothetical protein